MQYSLKVFHDPQHDTFRVIDRNGEPWFVLLDVCKKLDIANPSDAASRLDDDEKDAVGITDAIGRAQKMTVISESGLYSLILRSTKPEAKRFRKWVTSEVLPSIRKTGGYELSQTPAFIRRFNENWHRVDAGHFSILSETVARVWGRLEMAGHRLADRAPDGKEIRLDGAVGSRFSSWLKANHPSVCDAHSFYLHKTPQWEGLVRQYPNSMLPLFIEFVETVWIPQYAEQYFSPRDPAALPYLQKLLPPSGAPKPGMMRHPTLTGRS
ncbi:Bro-N domain-containing protein [Ancylobacter polymorphus]|uniref:Bro-N domain-containing protein n=1 Tax=Ancylobacter polymorphus TaxID=223390 RepID=A0A9E7CVY6_9HYPH|nr:Bro-N domain-containing protein [Ancylobacter polymorphus]UOK70209.1 Bro-N domain-containing protein [Ancylobacter polymorphus]